MYDKGYEVTGKGGTDSFRVGEKFRTECTIDVSGAIEGRDRSGPDLWGMTSNEVWCGHTRTGGRDPNSKNSRLWTTWEWNVGRSRLVRSYPRTLNKFGITTKKYRQTGTPSMNWRDPKSKDLYVYMHIYI